MPRWFTLAAAAVVVAHLAICATAGWPKGMQQVFWNPTVLYLPDQSRAYVLGGRISGTDTPPYAINDVAVLQLNYSFSVADANTASVQPAPFSLPSPDYRMAGLISQTAANSEEYTVVLLSGLNTGGVPPPRTYAINNLLHATDVSVINAVTTVPGFAYLGSPAWGSTVKPIVGGSSNSLVSDPAAYFYGNWSTVNNELFRLTFGGKLELVNINTSQPMPPPSGWGSLVRYNLTHLLVAGGNPGDNAAPKVPEIWLCNLVSNAWSKYPYNMPDARDDFQSVVVPDPGSSTGKYVVFIGSSDTGFINYVNLDKLTSPLRGVVTGSPSGAFTSASRTAAMAAFYHDNHIFLVGGINTGTPKPGNGVASLAAVKVTKPADGATGLSFQWVDNFVPSSGQGPIDVSPKVVPPPIEQPTTGSSLSAGAWIAISLSLALVAALGAVVAVRRLKASKSGEYGSVYTNGGTVGIDGPMVPRSGPRVSESANGVRSQAGDSDQVDGATAAAAIDAYLMRQRLENLGQYHSPPPPQQMMGQDLGYGVPPTSQGGMYPPPPPPQPPNGGGAYPTPPAPPSTSTAAYSQLSPEQQLLLQQQIQIQQLQLQQLQQLQQQRVSMNGLIPPHLLAALVPNGSGLPVSGGGSMPPLYAAPGSMQYAGSLPQPPMTPMSSGHGGGGDSSGGGYVMAMPMPLGGGGANGGQHWLAPPQQQQQQLLHPHHPLLKMPSMASLQALAPGGIVPGTGPEDDSGILEGLPEVPAAPAAAQPAAAVPATTTGAHESISTPPMPGRDFLTNPFSVDERSLLLGPGPTAARWEAAVASDRIEQDQRHHMQIQQQIQQQIQRHSAAIQAQLQQQQGQGQQ